MWDEGRFMEAMEAQQLLSAADWVLTKTAIPGTRAPCRITMGMEVTHDGRWDG